MIRTSIQLTRRHLLLSLPSLAGVSVLGAQSLASAGSKKDKFSVQQKKDILKVQEEAEKQIFDVLSPEQKAAQKEAIKQGNERPDLKLTDQQKAEIKKIRSQANQHTNTILGIK